MGDRETENSIVQIVKIIQARVSELKWHAMCYIDTKKLHTKKILKYMI